MIASLKAHYKICQLLLDHGAVIDLPHKVCMGLDS
jgi:hypothetical protein